MRPCNPALLGFPVDCEQAQKFTDLRFALGNPRAHPVETPAESIGRGQVSLLNCQLEELELGLEVNHCVVSASRDLEGVMPNLRRLLVVPLQCFDLTPQNPATRTNSVCIQLGGEPLCCV